MPVLAMNKRAFFDYEILEKLEAGLVLTGQEVKAARDGQVSLKGAYVTLTGNEAWLINAHISPYKKAGEIKNYEPTHSRKLLLRRAEINRLQASREAKGLTIMPLKLYTRNHRIKVEIGLARGRQKADKRETIKKRDIDKAIKRELME